MKLTQKSESKKNVYDLFCMQKQTDISQWKEEELCTLINLLIETQNTEEEACLLKDCLVQLEQFSGYKEDVLQHDKICLALEQAANQKEKRNEIIMHIRHKKRRISRFSYAGSAITSILGVAIFSFSGMSAYAPSNSFLTLYPEVAITARPGEESGMEFLEEHIPYLDRFEEIYPFITLPQTLPSAYQFEEAVTYQTKKTKTYTINYTNPDAEKITILVDRNYENKSKKRMLAPYEEYDYCLITENTTCYVQIQEKQQVAAWVGDQNIFYVVSISDMSVDMYSFLQTFKTFMEIEDVNVRILTEKSF